ncbi:calcium homeostasis modulator protein 6 [Etheostoma spectabile]|uniref:calcium homeostasis modulator protein 6 n=1 Tax=Etheostoma spectabile TaxID=54343 RepID=UPI0013AF4AC6|nr:calcium homeostasis modulator protein 6-like [Etheostoma spectabile]
MEKFKKILDIATQQDRLGFGAVALVTAGGEQIFSSAIFSCPCNELNFLYGLVFLLVPALALLLLGYILSKKTWKTLTGVCQHRAGWCLHWRRLIVVCTALFQVSNTALVAPASWIAVALINGKYYECAMTGTNVSVYNKLLCGDKDSGVRCQRELYRLPCGTGSSVPQADRQDVLLTLKAQSQILGWLLVAAVMLSSLLLTCVARCTSPISYLQLRFWRAYATEENNLLDSYTTQHAKQLAERNIKSFFNKTPPENIITPSNNDWEKVSTLYRFSTTDNYYSTLHRAVEDWQEADNGMMRLASVKTQEPSDHTPAVLSFVDEGRV